MSGMYATVGGTDIFYTSAGAGPPCLVPSLAGTPIYERFLPPPEADYEPLVETAAGDTAGLERLDPVCLMDVDPATARHKVEYQGRTIAFCAPSCKKLFLENPAAYVAA